MPDRTETVWELEPHTRAKHDLLRRYLGAWFGIMGRSAGRIVFFDGFAGPGTYTGGEPGSPVIALTTLLDHKNRHDACEYVLIFNEADRARYDSLQEVLRPLRARAPKNISIHESNLQFSALVDDILGALGANHLAPTFAFVDPFGYKDISMDQLRRFLSFPRCELFIYFDYNSVNRFATGGVVDERFTDLFGTTRFRSAPPAGDASRKTYLHDLYQDQLKAVCGFEYVQSFEMLTGQNRTGHYLFFCTRNIKGLKVMKSAMWKVDSTGEYRFADYLAGQAVLFGGDVDTTDLQNAIFNAFRGTTVTVQQVVDWVVINTPYAEEHVRKQTLKPMQEQGKVASPNQRRRGTFPDGTLLAFN